MKKTFLITLFVVSLALTGCIQQTPAENQNIDQPIIDQVGKDNLIYTDSIYNFSLELPATWVGYKTKRTEITGATMIYFGFDGWDDIFSIAVYTTQPVSTPGEKYLGNDGNYFYYSGASTGAILIQNLEPRRNEYGDIIKTFKAVNLTNEIDDWKTYLNGQYNFQIQYPTNYKTVVDTYGWPNSVARFIETTPPGAQAYRATISVWDNQSDYTDSSVYKTMRYSMTKINNKYVVISYNAMNSETDLINEWMRIINTLKVTQ